MLTTEIITHVIKDQENSLIKGETSAIKIMNKTLNHLFRHQDLLAPNCKPVYILFCLQSKIYIAFFSPQIC